MIKPSRCPFTPTCSNYSIQSLKKYGALKGAFLSAWRILRCNPFNKGYYDPPEHWGERFGFRQIDNEK